MQSAFSAPATCPRLGLLSLCSELSAQFTEDSGRPKGPTALTQGVWHQVCVW